MSASSDPALDLAGLRRLLARVGRLLELPEDELTTPRPEVSSWSVGQHLFHLVLAGDLSLRNVKSLVARRGRLIRDFEQRDETYAESVRAADRAVGEIVKTLDAWADRDGTLLVVTSDHGERFLSDRHVIPGMRAHHGNPSYEELLRVPLVVVPAPTDAMAAVTV